MGRDHLRQSTNVGLSIGARAGATAATAQCLSAALLLLAALPVCAQQLSVRRYNVSDGLAHSHVGAIHQDRKGYLWFGTREGLSRFDGYRFTNYGERDGLGQMIVNDIAEDRQGRLWVGTNGGGVSRLIDDPRETHSSHQTEPAPGARRRFVSFRVAESQESNRVNALLFDPADNLWLVTDHGLYRSSAVSSRDPQFKLVVPHGKTATDMAAFADSRGRLWFGMLDELIQVVGDQIIKYRDGKQTLYTDAQGLSGNHILSLAEDRDGNLWVGTFVSGVCKLSGELIVSFTRTEGLPNQIVGRVIEDRLLLRVRDNGRGFDPSGDAATSRNGNGLVSMRERARAMGGEIEIISQANQGTAIKLDLPLSPRAGSRWRKYLPV